DSGTAFSAALKPILEWVPSQNGFSVDAPQRQSAIRFSTGNLFPSLSINSTSPFTMYGPFLIVSIVLSALPLFYCIVNRRGDISNFFGISRRFFALLRNEKLKINTHESFCSRFNFF